MRQRQGRTFQSSGFSAEGTGDISFCVCHCEETKKKNDISDDQVAKHDRQSSGGRPGLPNNPYGHCGRKATVEHNVRAQELHESRGGRPGLAVPNAIVRTASLYVKQHWTTASEFRSRMRVDVDVLGSQSLMVRTVSVDVKQHLKKQNTKSQSWHSIVVLGLQAVFVLGLRQKIRRRHESDNCY